MTVNPQNDNRGDNMIDVEITYNNCTIASLSDSGKVLAVANGAWPVASLPLYNGGVS